MEKRKYFYVIVMLCMVFLLCGFNGCGEKYIVGIVPVYTEESWHDEKLTITERLNIEGGYHEAVSESRRYNRTVDPLYLECSKYIFGYSNCSKALNPYESWRKDVRRFYADYFFSKKPGKDIRHFMKMNGINLLIMSAYIKNRKTQAYDIELRVIKFIHGTEKSVTRRRDTFSVSDFEDSQRLKHMSKESLMRIMDQIERTNPN